MLSGLCCGGGNEDIDVLHRSSASGGGQIGNYFGRMVASADVAASADPAGRSAPGQGRVAGRFSCRAVPRHLQRPMTLRYDRNRNGFLKENKLVKLKLTFCVQRLYG